MNTGQESLARLIGHRPVYLDPGLRRDDGGAWHRLGRFPSDLFDGAVLRNLHLGESVQALVYPAFAIATPETVRYSCAKLCWSRERYGWMRAGRGSNG